MNGGNFSVNILWFYSNYSFCKLQSPSPLFVIKMKLFTYFNCVFEITLFCCVSRFNSRLYTEEMDFIMLIILLNRLKNENYSLIFVEIYLRLLTFITHAAHLSSFLCSSEWECKEQMHVFILWSSAFLLWTFWLQE